MGKNGSLRSVWFAVRQAGNIAIPLSSMIVGAELYCALAKSSAPEAIREKRESETFGLFPSVMILLIRLVLMPWIGRQMHRWLKLADTMGDPLLSVMTLVEWNVPTANNCILMVSIIAEKLPVLGGKLREDVSKCIFWQYMALPVLLTLNTFLLLQVQFPNS